jgi:hypothetical protein
LPGLNLRRGPTLRRPFRHWNLPLLSWKDGKVVATKP